MREPADRTNLEENTVEKEMQSAKIETGEFDKEIDADEEIFMYQMNSPEELTTLKCSLGRKKMNETNSKMVFHLSALFK